MTCKMCLKGVLSELVCYNTFHIFGPNLRSIDQGGAIVYIFVKVPSQEVQKFQDQSQMSYKRKAILKSEPNELQEKSYCGNLI